MERQREREERKEPPERTEQTKRGDRDERHEEDRKHIPAGKPCLGCVIGARNRQDVPARRQAQMCAKALDVLGPTHRRE